MAQQLVRMVYLIELHLSLSLLQKVYVILFERGRRFVVRGGLLPPLLDDILNM